MSFRRQTLSLLVSMALFLQSAPPLQVANLPSFAAAQDTIPPYSLTPKDAVQLQCDQLAAPPDDPQKVGAGVPFDQIKVNEALDVCRQASMGQAWRARYLFLYGRALEASQKNSEAAKQYKLAAQYIHPQAAFRLDRLYETGQGVTKN
ncbi:MAG: hypothetical protein U0V70_03120 [Terriglobia bacterium]